MLVEESLTLTTSGAPAARIVIPNIRCGLFFLLSQVSAKTKTRLRGWKFLGSGKAG